MINPLAYWPVFLRDLILLQVYKNQISYEILTETWKLISFRFPFDDSFQAHRDLPLGHQHHGHHHHISGNLEPKSIKICADGGENPKGKK